MADLEGGTALSLDRHLGASDTAEAIESYTEIEIPESLRDNLVLFLRMERKVLKEYDPAVCALFDRLFNSMIRANEGNPGTVAADEPTDAQGIPTADTEGARAFREAVELIDALPVDQAQVVVRAFASFFHLANLSEENYRVETLRELRAQRVDGVGRGHIERAGGGVRPPTGRGGPRTHGRAAGPAWNSTPCSPRTPPRRAAKRWRARSAVSPRCWTSIRYLGGSALLENERHMLQEIDALVRTSPTELKKPTPRGRGRHHHRHLRQHAVRYSAAGVPAFRRLGAGRGRRQRAARVPGVLPSGQLDRVGPRREPERHRARCRAAWRAKYFAHMVAKLAQECRNIGRNLTLESRYTAPLGTELMNLWSHLVEMSETLTGRVAD